MDRLSDLDDLLIEKILVSMPTVDAVRTCVLSKAWLYKWTMLPKLVLDDQFFLRTSGIKMTSDFVHVVSSLLVQHKGPLEEFYLVLPDLVYPKDYYLNQVIRTVLVQGIKKLTIYKWGAREHNWPSSFPTSPSLTDMKLVYCKLKREPFCRGFENLNSLNFDCVQCDPGTLSSCISNSPKLQKIILRNLDYEGHLLTIFAPMLECLYVRGKFKSLHLPLAQNLRELEIYLNFMSEYSEWEMAYLINFFGSLVRLQSLTLGGTIYELFRLAGLLTMLPRGFGELRYLKLTCVEFCDVAMLRIFLCFIRSSPRLCRLEIITDPPSVCGEELNLQVQMNEHCTLEHLEKVYIGPVIGTTNELDMIEFLLHCSPALQVIAVWQGGSPDRNGKTRFKKALGRFHRASASVKIDVFYHYRDDFYQS